MRSNLGYLPKSFSTLLVFIECKPKIVLKIKTEKFNVCNCLKTGKKRKKLWFFHKFGPIWTGLNQFRPISGNVIQFLTLEAKACSDLPVSTLSTMVPRSGDGPVTFLAQTKQTLSGNSLRLRTTSSWKSPFRHFPFTWN